MCLIYMMARLSSVDRKHTTGVLPAACSKLFVSIIIIFGFYGPFKNIDCTYIEPVVKHMWAKTLVCIWFNQLITYEAYTSLCL